MKSAVFKNAIAEIEKDHAPGEGYTITVALRSGGSISGGHQLTPVMGGHRLMIEGPERPNELGFRRRHHIDLDDVVSISCDPD